MKQRLTLLAAAFCFLLGLSSGSATETQKESKGLASETFVVDSSELDASESLNRIAGEIDTGFGDRSSGYYYKSDKQRGRSGPFDNAEAHGY